MSEYSRTFDAARKAQGFTSQAQLDAFFAHYDHVYACTACHALDSYAAVSGSWAEWRITPNEESKLRQ